MRKTRLIRREVGESSVSLHDDSLEVLSEKPTLSEEFFDETVNDAMKSFADKTGSSKPWFSNGRTTIQKIEADVECVSHLLASIFINDEQWIKLVESHNINLHGDDQPLMDLKIMQAYFGDVASIRSRAFDLVRFVCLILFCNNVSIRSNIRTTEQGSNSNGDHDSWNKLNGTRKPQTDRKRNACQKDPFRNRNIQS